MQLGYKFAEIIGYDLVKTSKNVLLRRHLHHLFDLLQIDCVLDVGANHGQYGAMLRAFGYRGRIISFEPVIDSFKKLLSTSEKDRNWDAYPFALGAKEEELEINVTTSSDFASFLPPSNFSRQTFGEVVGVAKKELVRVKRLDNVFAMIMKETPVKAIHLKMDTQGYDLEVFKGGESVLNRISALQSELSLLPVYEGMPDYLEVLARYRQAGFEVTGLFPVSHDRETLAVIEFDCVCRRK